MEYFVLDSNNNPIQASKEEYDNFVENDRNILAYNYDSNFSIISKFIGDDGIYYQSIINNDIIHTFYSKSECLDFHNQICSDNIIDSSQCDSDFDERMNIEDDYESWGESEDEYEINKAYYNKRKLW